MKEFVAIRSVLHFSIILVTARHHRGLFGANRLCLDVLVASFHCRLLVVQLCHMDCKNHAARLSFCTCRKTHCICSCRKSFQRLLTGVRKPNPLVDALSSQKHLLQRRSRHHRLAGCACRRQKVDQHVPNHWALLFQYICHHLGV